MGSIQSLGQARVDAVFQAAKEMRRLVEIAERARIAPESLILDEIKRISEFVLRHQACDALASPAR